MLWHYRLRNGDTTDTADSAPTQSNRARLDFSRSDSRASFNTAAYGDGRRLGGCGLSDGCN